MSPPAGVRIDASSANVGKAPMERMSREEFAVFYQQTAPALRRYLARIAANPDLSDDLLQEAYIRLIHAAPVAKRNAGHTSTAQPPTWYGTTSAPSGGSGLGSPSGDGGSRLRWSHGIR